MKKLLISFVVIFLSLNVSATIPQSGISNLRELDSNEIIELISGNKLSGVVSNGPREGPVVQTFFKNGKYETIFDDKIYTGVWKVENKKYCSKNNSATNFSCTAWYIGNRHGGTFAFIISEGNIIHQYHESITIVKENQENKSAEKVETNKEIEDKKKTPKEYVLSFFEEMHEKSVSLRFNDTQIYQKIRDDHDLYKIWMYRTVYTNVGVSFSFPSNTKKDNNSNYCWIEIDYGDGSEKTTERKRRWSDPYVSHKYKKSGVFNLTIRGDGSCKVNNNSLRVYVMDLDKAILLARQDKAEAKRSANEKKAEAKRSAEIKKVQKKIDLFLKELKNQDVDSFKIEVDKLISGVENNKNSDLKVLRSFEGKLSNLYSRIRMLSLKDYPGFKDLKPGLPYEGVLEICPLEKINIYGQKDDESNQSDWVRCYDINNIKFKASYFGDLLTWLSLDMGPIVELGGYLSIFGENDSNIFIKMQDTFDKKYTLDYGYSERDRQLFNESEKTGLYRVYSKGQVVLEISRKEKDYSIDLWLHIYYLDPAEAKEFLEKYRPVRASEDDF